MKRTLNILGIALLIVALFTLLTLAAYSVNGQTTGPDAQSPRPSGGQFTLQKSVVAGGGAALHGRPFSIDATAGQSAAGRCLSGGGFKIFSGFWTPGEFALSIMGGRGLSTDIKNLRRK